MKKWLIVPVLLAGSACADDPAAPPEGASCGKDLKNRAYVVSRDSDDLTVLDLGCLEIVGNAKLGTRNAHMVEIGPDAEEVFVTSAGTNEVVAVSARDLGVRARIPLAEEPTHLTLEPRGKLLAVMVEGTDEVAFVDARTHVVTKRLGGFHHPHFLRATRDGRWGFVANHGSYAVTRVDMDRLEVDGEIALDGYSGDRHTDDPEGGFADAQIDDRGVLYAAHAETGRVLVYDTARGERLPELRGVGERPWVVFAEHPFKDLPRTHVVPSFASATVSFIDGDARRVDGLIAGDREAYGVNYSPRAPGVAFVMNRVRAEVAVVDTKAKQTLASIDVGGTTETASTTADGRYIVATVSSANRVVVIDVETRRVVKAFDGVGRYPWAVVIPGGQNYCH